MSERTPAQEDHAEWRELFDASSTGSNTITVGKMASTAFDRAEEVAADVASLVEQIADMTVKYKYFCDLWNPMVERQHEFDQRISHQYDRITTLEQRAASQQTVAADDPHGVDECKCRHEQHWHSHLDSECRYPGCPCMSFKPYPAVSPDAPTVDPIPTTVTVKIDDLRTVLGRFSGADIDRAEWRAYNALAAVVWPKKSHGKEH